jgi:hypothetical protein
MHQLRQFCCSHEVNLIEETRRRLSHGGVDVGCWLVGFGEPHKQGRRVAREGAKVVL